MRFLVPVAGLVCLSVLCAQTPEDTDVAKAKAGIEKLRDLVNAGAAPRVELEQAEEALADAQDFSFLRKTLYGSELTEDQLDAMVAAAGRRLDRRKQAVTRAQNLIDVGVASQASLGTYLEAQDWAQKEYDLAVSRAQSVRDLARMADQERTLQHRIEDAPDTAKQIAERFDGNGIFSPEEFAKIARAFEQHFGKALPISAMGETAVHRALGFDHRGRVDVALNPDQPEGKWLREYLESNKIPFFAFWQAVPGKATGAHIHIGRMSTRLAHGG